MFLRLDAISTFRGVHTLIFTYVPHTDICLHREPANFYREKRSVAFVTGHLFTFLVVLSLSCLVTMQILKCENQAISRLEILLMKNDCRRLFKNQMQWPLCFDKRYQETGKEYFTKVQMIVKDEVY